MKRLGRPVWACGSALLFSVLSFTQSLSTSCSSVVIPSGKCNILQMRHETYKVHSFPVLDSVIQKTLKSLMLVDKLPTGHFWLF